MTVEHCVEIAVYCLVVSPIGEDRTDYAVGAVVNVVEVELVVRGLHYRVVDIRSRNGDPAVGVGILLRKGGKTRTHFRELFVIISGYDICAESETIG